MAVLRILNADKSGQILTLSKDAIVLGRHPNCDVVLPDETISRQHARITRRADGFYVEDLGSRNGTFLNGQKVTKAAGMTHLDQIQLFNTTIIFLDDEPGRSGDLKYSTTVQSSRSQTPRTEQTVFYETIAEIDVSQRVPDQKNETDVKLQAMLEITRYLQSTLEPDEILFRIVECVAQIFPHYSRSYLLRHNELTNQLVPVVIKQQADEVVGPVTLQPITQALARQVLAEGKAILSVGTHVDRQDAAQSSIFDSEKRSFMCVPLIGPSRMPAGILYIETLDSERRFSHDDLEVFVSVAILAGQAIEQATWFGARYRAVVDTAVDGIFTINERGIIESVNPAVVKLFGYEKHELIGRNINMLMSPPDTEFHEGNLAEYLLTGKAKILGVGRESVARRNDGTMFPIYLSIGEFALGGQHHFTGIVHDISERHRAETALRKLNESLEQLVRDRTEYIRLLQDVAVIANESESVEEAFRVALERICRFRNLETGHVLVHSAFEPTVFVDSGIWIGERKERFRRLIDATEKTEFPSDEGIVGRVVASAKPEWIRSLSEAADFARSADAVACGLKAAVVFPVLIGNEVVALVELFSIESDEIDATFLEAMQQVGTHLGRVIERDRLQKQLIDAVWNQHRRFGQELHDTLGQALTGIAMLADSLAKKLNTRGVPDAEKLTELAGMIQQAKTEMRQLSKGLYPVDIDAQGLLSALEELADTTQQRWHVECVFSGDPDILIQDNEVATHLFRIAQEAVNNSIKHAKPKEISIHLLKKKGRVTLAIQDDGSGIAEQASPRAGGLGMRIMQYRAKVMGAELAIETTECGGTVVRCALKKEPDYAQR